MVRPVTTLLTRAEARARIALDGRAPEDVPEVADWRAR
jgi:hypothetical protein